MNAPINLLKAIGGGVLLVLVTWVGIVSIWYRRLMANAPKGLGGVAGGWDYLLSYPLVALLLSIAFGVGFYLTVRWLHR